MSSITKEWTESDFRRELRKIDDYVRETQNIELSGCELEIVIPPRISGAIAAYYPCEKKFEFSQKFFNSDIPENCAVDVIRHEYAHYYVDVVLGKRCGHREPFKSVCRLIGVNRDIYFTKEFEEMERQREKWQHIKYDSCVKIGQRINHPVYGYGIVEDIVNKQTSASVIIDFGKKGVKVVDDMWLRQNIGVD